jgi:2-polyprenyl-6-methoxyphenol hydroxylase-like FAD-dependent oxidoreductase
VRVLIAGGGIAGLLTAIALRRRAIDAAVFESSPPDAAQGSGLLLGANALELLTRLGLYDAVRARGREPTAMGVFSPSGTPVSVVDAGEWQARYGFRSVAVHREALHDVLRAALPDDAVEYGRRVLGFEQTADRVRLRFESGSDADGDVLVGADGLRSAIRERLLGGPKLRYSGQTSYRAIVDHVVDTGPFADKLCEFWGNSGGLRFGFGRIDERRTYFFTTHRVPAGQRDASPEDAHRFLRGAFRSFPEEVRALVDHALSDRLIRTDIHDFAPLRCWHRGRVVLVGDAAHATTPNLGQGACQAIESSYVLARELAQRDVERAFTEYETIRMPRAHYVTRMSWRFGQLVGLRGPLGRFVRFGVMPRLSTDGMYEQTDRIFKLPY